MPYNPQISVITEISLPNNFSFVNNNSGIILTMDNEIMFCDDIEYIGVYTNNTVIFTLPDTKMEPLYNTSFIIPVSTSYGIQLEECKVTTNGELIVDNSFYNPIFKLNGVMVNINGKYFSSALNNLSGYTSQLDLY